MNKQLCILVLIGFIKMSVSGQNVFQKAFQRNFSQAYGGTQTSDGGFVMAGLYQVSEFDYDYLAVKMDQFGDTVWTKTYGGIGDEECYAMQLTTDGGFILAGIDSSSGIGNYNVYLVKTDSNGDTLWTKSYGGASDDFGQAVQQTSDGGYIVAGYTGSFTTDGNNDMYLLRTDANGNLIWSKTYGGAYGDYAMSVKQTSDGGYIAAGLTSSYGISPYGNVNDIFVVKTDANGNLTWSKTYGQDGDDWAYGIIQTTDGGYAISGHTCTDSTTAYSDAYLIKTDANGDTLWTKSYGGSSFEKGIAILQLSADSSIVMAGSTYSYGHGISDALLLNTDKNGNILMASVFGGTGNDFAYALSSNADGGYGLYGYTDNFGVSNSSFYFVKTDHYGDGCHINPTVAINTTTTTINTINPTVTTPATITKQNTFTVIGDSVQVIDVCASTTGNTQFKNQNNQLKIYPNPTNSVLNVMFNSNNNTYQEFAITNLLGNCVMHGFMYNLAELNLNSLNTGIYFIRVGNSVQKFVKE